MDLFDKNYKQHKVCTYLFSTFPKGWFLFNLCHTPKAAAALFFWSIHVIQMAELVCAKSKKLIIYH